MRVALAVAVALAVVSAAGAEQALASIRKPTQIPAQDLSTALKNFAAERQVAMIYRAELVGGHNTAGAAGDLTLDEALQALLSGTQLTYRYLDEKTVTIVPIAMASSTANQGTDGGLLRLAQGAQSSNSNATRGAPAPEVLDEVVVTAEKRTERQQDVPLSLTVLSGDRLISEGVVQLADYVKQVPGMNFVGSTGPGSGQVTMRGLSTGPGNDISGVVGIFLDDVPFTSSSPNSTATWNPGLSKSFDPDLADIERIEVLAGPQSTLYGASAVGGLIKFVTRRPDFNQFDGSVRTEGSQIDGGGAGYGIRGSVNMPLITDRAGLRASAFYRHDGGFIDNTSPGYEGRDVNSDTIKGLRLSLRTQLTDQLEATLSGLIQDIDGKGLNSVYPIDPVTFKPAGGALRAAEKFPEPYSSQYRSLSLTTPWDLHFATLTNIASYTKTRADSILDYSNLSQFIGGAPVLYRLHPDTTRYTDELRLTSAPGRIEWLVGAFYTHEKDLVRLDMRGTDSTGTVLPPTASAYNILTYRTDSLFDEKAGFGDLTYHLTSQWEGTVGVRHSSNHQSETYFATGIFGSNNVAGPSNDSATNYLATVSYKPTTTATLYLRAASAYRPGGINVLFPVEVDAGVPGSFHSDKVWNYEAGIKGSALDRHIVYSVDAYHMRWTNMQIPVLFAGPITYIYTGNAAGAKSDGVDASIDLIPVKDLSIGLRGAYTNAKLTADAPTLGGLNGDPLPYSPRSKVALLGDYRLPVSDRVALTTGLTYSYNGSQYTAINQATRFKLPSYDSLDLRSGVEWSRYSVIARVDNVTNNLGPVALGISNTVGAPQNAIVAKPRTFGLSFEARFE